MGERAVPATNPISAQMVAVLTEFGMVEGQDFTMESLQTPVEMGTLYPAFTSTMAKGNSTTDSPESSPESTSLEFVCSDRQYDLYWYHPNYLGSVDLVTNKSGRVHQFFMYTAWGEAMYEYTAQSTTGSFDSPYRFNGKELDKETGYGYYGARYYQSKLSMWLSVDPEAARDPNMGPYHFVYNNPIMVIDPNGRHGYRVSEDGSIERIDANAYPEEAASGGDDFDVLYNHNMSDAMAATFDPGILSGTNRVDKNGNKYSEFTMENQQTAEEAFRFLAENSGVEWGQIKYIDKTGTKSTLTSSHSDSREEYGPNMALDYHNLGLKVLSLDHSHPTNEIHGYAGPSGYHIRDATRYEEENDLQTAKKLEKEIPGIKFNVYDVSTKSYIPYNSKGKIK